MSVIRTFIAVRASQRVTTNVARVVSRLAAISDQYRWVVPENLHVTLNFVGDVRDIEVPELCQLVRETVQPLSSFDLSLHGVSAFPQPDQPRVIWIGVDQGQEALQSIYSALQEKLHVWGINKDRKPYVPHMTLGRVIRAGRWSEELLQQMHRLRSHDGGSCHVREVTVFSSFLDRGGPTYTPMARISLRP